jgi:futalosine hydrolase
MRLLLVAATDQEIAPLVARLTPVSHSLERWASFGYGPLAALGHGSHDVDILVTGVGMTATATWCARALARQSYDLAVNLGVCGSFDPACPPGTVVNVMTDCFPELGAEDGEQFLTIQDLGLLRPGDPPDGRLVNPFVPPHAAIGTLRRVNGVTVNTVHGNDDSIARVVQRLKPDVESMEGAAFMYACLVSGVRFAQVRAVSNMVERRNRAAWKLVEAVGALNGVALRLLEEL